MADEAGIDLTGPPRYEKAIKKIIDERDRKAKAMKKWDKVNWATKLRAYTSKHGGKSRFGGHQYDITKQSAAERKRHSLEYVREELNAELRRTALIYDLPI